MIKDFFIRQMLKKQLKDVPEEEQEKLIQLVTQNPELFTKIAEKAKGKMDNGKSQVEAIMEAAMEHKSELESLMKK